MTDVNLTEEQHAKERNVTLQKDLTSRRNWFVILTIACFVFSFLLALGGVWIIAVSLFILGLTFLSQYADTNGHLHDVQSRSAKSLTHDFSILEKPATRPKTPTPGTGVVPGSQGHITNG